MWKKKRNHRAILGRNEKFSIAENQKKVPKGYLLMIFLGFLFVCLFLYVGTIAWQNECLLFFPIKINQPLQFEFLLSDLFRLVFHRESALKSFLYIVFYCKNFFSKLWGTPSVRLCFGLALPPPEPLFSVQGIPCFPPK